jgi:uncharacterized protein YjiS (DUF1127 family)
MENIDNATVFSRVTQQGVGRRRVGALLAFLRAAYEAMRSRRDLIGLDDHLRADIGISRGEALMESQRRVWDLETPPDPTRRPRGR